MTKGNSLQTCISVMTWFDCLTLRFTQDHFRMSTYFFRPSANFFPNSPSTWLNMSTVRSCNKWELVLMKQNTQNFCLQFCHFQYYLQCMSSHSTTGKRVPTPTFPLPFIQIKRSNVTSCYVGLRNSVALLLGKKVH
jgi:hypothetical protein